MSQLFLWHNLKNCLEDGAKLFSAHDLVLIQNVLVVIIFFLFTSNLSMKVSFRYEVDYFVLACTIASGLQVIYFYVQVFQETLFLLPGHKPG